MNPKPSSSTSFRGCRRQNPESTSIETRRQHVDSGFRLCRPRNDGSTRRGAGRLEVPGTVRAIAIALLTLALTACGFHLRQSAVLPPGMQKVHVSVSGDADLADQLERELVQAGATVVGHSGPGVAGLKVQARFSTRALTVSSYARVREFSVNYSSDFLAVAADGKPLLKRQHIDMQREFTYDRTQALGTATREDQIRASLVTDMARAILRHLQAAVPDPGS